MPSVSALNANTHIHDSDSSCVFVHWIGLVVIFVHNAARFILCDSFLRESLIHSLQTELLKPRLFIFFLALRKGVDKNTLHHSNLSTADFYVSFLLFSTYCEFLRLHLSHIPAKETMFCYAVFLWHCSRWEAVSQWHKEVLDIVEIFCPGGKRRISSPFTYENWLDSPSMS